MRKRDCFYPETKCSISPVVAWPERTASVSLSPDLLLDMIADVLGDRDTHPTDVDAFVVQLTVMLVEHAAGQPSEYAVGLAVGQAVAR